MHASPLCLALLALVPPAAAAQDAVPAWPQFRGPGGLAVAADTPIPLDFGPESRVLWKASIPAGHSSPCVYGDRIFVTGAEEKTLFVVALDRTSGEVLWTRELEGEPEPEYGHVAAALAMSTPCTDGERVFVYFGAYGLLALDLDGKTVWEFNNRHIASISTLTPMIEGTLRSLMKSKGIEILRNKDDIILDKELGGILADTKVKELLGENFTNYIKTKYADPDGMNERNKVSHALSKSVEFRHESSLALIKTICNIAELSLKTE